MIKNFIKSVLHNLINCILISAVILFLGSGTAIRLHATGNCVGPNWVSPTNPTCTCTGGACPTITVITTGYYECGGGSEAFCESAAVVVGNTFPCAASINWGHYLVCIGNAAGCGIVCASVVTGIGLVACLACLAVYGGNCATCNLTTCTATAGTPFFGNLMGAHGGTCP